MRIDSALLAAKAARGIAWGTNRKGAGAFAAAGWGEQGGAANPMDLGGEDGPVKWQAEAGAKSRYSKPMARGHKPLSANFCPA
jgi:hypothetical protein